MPATSDPNYDMFLPGWTKRFPVLRGLIIFIFGAPIVIAALVAYVVASLISGAIIAIVVPPLWVLGGLSVLGSDDDLVICAPCRSTPKPWPLRAADFVLDTFGILWGIKDRPHWKAREDSFEFFCGAMGCLAYLIVAIIGTSILIS